jgi:thiol:disulfide interchange protein
MRPSALKFTAKINVAAASGSQPAAVELVSAKRSEVLDEAATRKWVDDVAMPEGKEEASENEKSTAPVVVPTSSSSFPTLLLFAFLGGIVLNVMPCVLPVIGLKVMSFVSQAGSDRKRVLALNLAYCAGIFVVFSALAALAVVFNFGWGEQFQYFSVRLGVTVGLFAFALSYFNVWEIPVPGMASNKTSQELQNKEGLTGAFSKGIFATLLATPCSGPLLGGVFGATIGLPGAQVVMIFLVMALGMSTPYLLIGLNPSWIKWLPKPEPWMETFKQLMAFFFLAAVAFFFYQFSDENKFPVFVTLIGVWFGCWIIGLVPNWQPLKKRLVAWASGVSIATAIGLSAFFVLKAAPELNWVDYNEASLKQYQSQGKTVLVDFSAKWCVNCLVNLETAIDTRKTRELVDELGVVSMYADWTNYDEAVTQKLTELNSKSIPVLAIYPADRPDEPIILRDIVTQSTVLEALRSAGPSNNANVASRNEQTIIASSKH